ncbi:hypothetical protein SLA2020_128490 [Shorea laevis]
MSLPLSGDITCSGCNLAIISGEYYYQCKTCPLILHQVCYKLPRKTSHPGHLDDNLTLHVVPSPVLATFKCKACEHSITGLYYACAECGVCYYTSWWCLSPWHSLPILTPSS